MDLPWHFSSNDTPIVYHYTSVKAARAMVETRAIWMSEFTAMNDASEFTYARDKLVTLLTNREVYIETLARTCVIFMLEGLTANTGLMLGSLTARRDDLGQWRSYANNGAGCVLGIDARYLEHDAGVAIRTVLYEEGLVDKMLRTALEVVQAQAEEAPSDPNELMEFARHLVADLFNVKHPGFADEREVRIARMLIRQGDASLEDVGGNRTGGGKVPALTVRMRNGAYGATRYIALPLSRKDGSSAIVSAGLGPTISISDAATQEAYFASHGLDVWRSTLPYRA
ncbi:DUF2971 domain-containing protein [Sphingobium sp. LMC3-1-1.1]|uniref:DUF2971 domain-containing protein n=1 Tax=unclassified Sphingobium TaxID=2611147 RepID=UPI00342BF2CE